MYKYGFDEASGNFQENNYNRGGTGGDYLISDIHDLGAASTPFITVPPEGISPRMSYYWIGENDFALENGVLIHEFVHGVSIRLVGGASNSGCLNTDNLEGWGMGEGWSDYFSLMLTIEEGDQGTENRFSGTWVLGQTPEEGPGVRPAPYSTDLMENSYTYNSIKTVYNPLTSRPRLQHSLGTVWSTMLWELTWALIAEHGFSEDFYAGSQGGAGNHRALALVTEGLKMTPCRPGFVEARDAILAADAILYGGEHHCLIWQAFAKRGLGFSASQGDSNSYTDGVEAFDLPPSCSDTPCNIFISLNETQMIDETLQQPTLSTINVPFAGAITDVNIFLEGTHSYMGDLEFELISPTGTSVVIMDNVCGGDDDFTIFLNDQADNPISCPINDDQAAQPSNPLSAFNGQNPYGDWTLRITDTGNGDTGALVFWSLDICYDFDASAGDCIITDIKQGLQQLDCNDDDNTYSQEVQITYYNANIPANSTLQVNGQNFSLTSSPQTVTLTGLPANGQAMDVTVVVLDQSCSFTKNEVFTAPIGCNDVNNCTSGPNSSGRIHPAVYKVNGDITTSGLVSAPDDVVLKASNSIFLEPDFEVQLGATFEASIEDCNAFVAETDFRTIEVEEQSQDAPVNKLQVYPNPFTDQTTIRYQMETSSQISMSIFDMNGKEWQQLVPLSQQAAGTYDIEFNARQMPPGLYTIILKTSNTVISKRLVLMK